MEGLRSWFKGRDEASKGLTEEQLVAKEAEMALKEARKSQTLASSSNTREYLSLLVSGGMVGMITGVLLAGFSSMTPEFLSNGVSVSHWMAKNPVDTVLIGGLLGMMYANYKSE